MPDLTPANHHPVVLRFDRGTLLLTGMDRNLLMRLFPNSIWAADDRVGCWRCAALHYASVRDTLRSCFGARWQDDIPVPETVVWPKLDLPPLRTDQQAAVDAWRTAGCRGQIIMPTGTGKSEIGLAAMVGAGTATLIVAPVRDLMYQWQHRILRRTGFDAGIVGDNLFNLREVTVTTYDSAYKADRVQLKALCATIKVDRQTLRADIQAHRAARQAQKGQHPAKG